MNTTHTIAASEVKTGLRAKLVRVFAIQVLMISIAAIVGVYITYVIVEDVLTRQALNGEAEHFWELRAQDPDQALPNTANMTGYLHPDPSTEIPAALLDLETGFGRADALPDRPLVHVSQREGLTLYLIFAEAQVSDLVFYFGLAPLAAVLLTVYALLFLTYRLSDQAISPMLNLAQALERFDFRSTDRLEIPVQPDDVDHETRLMVEALEEFSDRLQQFIERERTFTRNAGHELRTPIAVMKGSIELLGGQARQFADDQQKDNALKVVGRMSRVVLEMETLLETLLMLAREENVFSDTPTSINQVITEEMELLIEVAEENNNTCTLTDEVEFYCNAKPRVLGIIVSNLLRNALTYTNDGRVDVAITASTITIRDTGIGMSAEDADRVFTAFYRGALAQDMVKGQGLGLALVRRLAQQLAWRVELNSAVGEGTEFRIFYTASSG
ncbi:MAG: HAMP domain-containing sensor histidine kinase [Pseudomonadota bacterium]